jgi:anti-anti-sigma regulatory factor
MRASGVAEHVRGFGVHDHVCWRYDTPNEFHERAKEFLVDGLSTGQRVLYIGLGDARSLAARLSEIKRLERALATGVAQVASAEETYPTGKMLDPARQVRIYAGLTDRAVAAGFTGLRVAADATPLARTSEQLDVLARYEHHIDHYMAGHPLAAMCAYDRAELGDDTIAQTACMHPSVSPGASGFRLHATDRPGCAAAVAGELDMVSAELWPLALRRAGLRARGDRELVLDAAGLEFIDHRSLLTLAEYARERAVTVVLRGAPHSAVRLVELLDVTNVCTEPT